MLSDLLLVLALVLLNGVFAMSEIEIVSSASRLGAALERLPLLAPYAGTQSFVAMVVLLSHGGLLDGCAEMDRQNRAEYWRRPLWVAIRAVEPAATA